MSAFSDEMAAVALALLTEFGEACTFSRQVLGSYDPNTSSKTLSSTTTFTGYVAPQDYLLFEKQSEYIQTGDIKLFANNVSAVPVPGDKVTFNSTTYRILRVIPYRVSGATVLYELQVRV